MADMAPVELMPPQNSVPITPEAPLDQQLIESQSARNAAGMGGIPEQMPQPVAAPEAGPPIDFSAVGAGPAVPPLPVTADQLFKQAQNIANTAKAEARDANQKRDAAEKLQETALGESAAISQKEAIASQPILQKAADEAQTLANARKAYLDQWKRRSEQLQAATLENQQLWKQLIAESHPKDIWQASGVNQIAGTIALFLGGLGAGPNPAAERINQLVEMRSQQLKVWGDAIQGQSNALAQQWAESSRLLGDEDAATAQLQAALKESVAAQIGAVANQYRAPQAKADADKLIGALRESAAKDNLAALQNASRIALQGLSQQTNLMDHLMAAGAKTTVDKHELTKIKEGAAATKQAIEILKELKQTVDPVARRQLEAELGPILAKADVPGSNRILTEEGRKAELQKLGGIELPLLGRIHRNEDSLIEALIKQQKERDHQFGTDTATELENFANSGGQAQSVLNQGIPVE